MIRLALTTLTLLALAGCSGKGPLQRGDDLAASCAKLAQPVEAKYIKLPTTGASIDSATLVAPSELQVAEQAPSPGARITPALPQHCRVLGRIAPFEPSAPPILFQLNLPIEWNGRAVQFGGAGFNGRLVTGTGLQPSGLYGAPAPLALGYATYGTDSGHPHTADVAPQAFAANDEALENFGHAAYKKVRDVAVQIMIRAYGRAPQKLYYIGSSEGGREGLAMAQRYPNDFDGVVARVPVINWTGLQLAGVRNGLATRGDAWLRPAQVKLVHDAVLASCDALDGLADGIVSDPVACKQRFDVTRLRCAAGASGDGCLSDAQVAAVQQLHAPYKLPFTVASGSTEYPGWGVSGEATPAHASTGGWSAWWLGSSPPTLPPQPGNGIAWAFGAGTVQHFFTRDPGVDVATFKPEHYTERIRDVSAVMDATYPYLAPFQRHGGKLIILENMADYAQSPYAGIRYHESVVAALGQAQVDQFVRLYTAPGVDHVGSGAPANVDLLAALADWVERDKAPAGLELVQQDLKPPFQITNTRPLCAWPLHTHYKSNGPTTQAASFECRP
ncbi:MAG TPA: tannase/feruloyl esterase family alpha/beta hydrolase [Rhizobacter sp.]|nr:tannase/feruloyl esterase family alpha/beta hydrolase [Rhizobacter sp.]